MKRVICVLSAGIFLASCRTTPEEQVLGRADNPCNATHMRSHAECRAAFMNSVYIADIRIGQTLDEVRSIMRNGPQQREATEDSESWLFHTDYRNRLWTRVVFKKGRVVEIKQFDMRRRR